MALRDSSVIFCFMLPPQVAVIHKTTLFLTDGEHSDKKRNTSIASLRTHSPSSRNHVQREIGTAFNFKSECCSTSSESTIDKVRISRGLLD